MATLENIGSDMEEEDKELFRRRESEGLIKIRPPEDDEEDSSSSGKDDNQNLNSGNNKGTPKRSRSSSAESKTPRELDDHLQQDLNDEWSASGVKHDKEEDYSGEDDNQNLNPGKNQESICGSEAVKCPICKSKRVPSRKDRKNRMIGCDGCDKWYHFVCVNITKQNTPGKKEQWFCRSCSEKNTGSPEWKPSKNEEKKLEIPSHREQNRGPSQSAIDDCRRHLAECLEQNNMTEFPIRRRTQTGEPVEFRILIHEDILNCKEEEEARKAAEARKGVQKAAASNLM